MTALNSNILKDTRTLVGMYQRNPEFKKRLNEFLAKDARIVFRRRPIKLYLEVLGSIESPNNYKFKHFYKEALKIRLGDTEGLIGKALNNVTSTDLIHLDSAIRRNTANQRALEYSDEEVEKINEAEKSGAKERDQKERLNKTDYMKEPETPEEIKKAEEKITEDEKAEKAFPEEESPSQPSQTEPYQPSQPSLPQTPSVSEARGYVSKAKSAKEFLANPSWGKFKNIFTGGGEKIVAEEAVGVAAGVAEGTVIRTGAVAGAEKVAGGAIGKGIVGSKVLAGAAGAGAKVAGKAVAGGIVRAGLGKAAVAAGSAIAGIASGGVTFVIQVILGVVTNPEAVKKLLKELFLIIAAIVILLIAYLYFGAHNFRGTKMDSMLPPYPLSGVPISIGGPSVSPGPIREFSINKICPTNVDNNKLFTYKVVLINNGKTNLSGNILDPLQPQVNYISCDDSINSKNCSYDPNNRTVTWRINNLAPGTKMEYSVDVLPNTDDYYVWNFADMGIPSGRTPNCLTQIGTPPAGTTPPPAPTPTPTISPKLGDIASCEFYRAGEKAPYQSQKLIKYIQDAAALSGVPEVVLAAIIRVESPTIVNFTDQTLENFKCEKSDTGALGLMQLQPIGTEGYCESCINLGASYIGKTADQLTRADYCDLRSNIIIAAGFILKKTNLMLRKPGTTWDPLWLTDKQYIDALAEGYYGCLLYGGPRDCTGPYNYGSDLWSSIINCKPSVPPIVPPIGDFKSYYCQSGNPWGGMTITGTSSTMASGGCGITSLAMILNYYGLNYTPEDVLQQFNRNPSWYDATYGARMDLAYEWLRSLGFEVVVLPRGNPINDLQQAIKNYTENGYLILGSQYINITNNLSHIYVVSKILPDGQVVLQDPDLSCTPSLTKSIDKIMEDYTPPRYNPQFGPWYYAMAIKKVR